MIKVKTTRKNKAGVFTATICIALISLTSMADGHTTTSSTCIFPPQDICAFLTNVMCRPDIATLVSQVEKGDVNS